MTTKSSLQSFGPSLQALLPTFWSATHPFSRGQPVSKALARLRGAVLRRTETATNSGGLWAAKVFCLPVGSATTKPSKKARSPLARQFLVILEI